jgi:hypothetical protein
MFGDGALTFQEFAMREPLPLSTIHDAVLGFLRGRHDAAVFGAQAVNAYVQQPRMTQDVDILSTCAEELAGELQRELSDRFRIAVRIRVVAGGSGYRLYQVRKPKNRHLVDVRSINRLPTCNRLGEILVPVPTELICQKLVSMVSRPNAPKGMTDKADLQRLLLAFPELKVADGEVANGLRAAGVEEKAMAAWYDLVAQEIMPEDDDD